MRVNKRARLSIKSPETLFDLFFSAAHKCLSTQSKAVGGDVLWDPVFLSLSNASSFFLWFADILQSLLRNATYFPELQPLEGYTAWVCFITTFKSVQYWRNTCPAPYRFISTINLFKALEIHWVETLAVAANIKAGVKFCLYLLCFVQFENVVSISNTNLDNCKQKIWPVKCMWHLAEHFLKVKLGWKPSFSVNRRQKMSNNDLIFSRWI